METVNYHTKNLIQILIFLVLFLIVFTFITYLAKPPSHNLDTISGFYCEEKNSLDMVYIGGSAAFVYWEPLKAYEETGLKSYSFASDTMQAELYSYMVKEILKNQNPEVILIDARAFQYRDVDQPPTEVAYRNLITGTPFSIDRALLIEDIVKNYLQEDTLSYHFDIMMYHSRAYEFEINDPIKKITHTYRHPYKGFFFVPKVDKITQYDFSTKKEVAPSDETVKILEDLLSYLKTTNKKILFVVSPYQELESHKENFNFVERKVKEAGFDFLDSNEYLEEMGINFNTDFYNIYHVNIYGADKYTNFLTKYILEHYNIKISSNHDWDSFLPEWKKQVNETKITINSLLGG